MGVAPAQPRVRPIYKQDCVHLTRKISEVQLEMLEYLAHGDEQRDRNYLNDSMMLHVTLRNLEEAIHAALNRGKS